MFTFSRQNVRSIFVCFYLYINQYTLCVNRLGMLWRFLQEFTYIIRVVYGHISLAQSNIFSGCIQILCVQFSGWYINAREQVLIRISDYSALMGSAYVTLLYQFQRKIQNIIRTRSFVSFVSFICFFLVKHHEKARYIFVFLLLLHRNYVARFTLGKIAVPGIRKKTPRYYKPWPNCGKIK